MYSSKPSVQAGQTDYWFHLFPNSASSFVKRWPRKTIITLYLIHHKPISRVPSTIQMPKSFVARCFTSAWKRCNANSQLLFSCTAQVVDKVVLVAVNWGCPTTEQANVNRHRTFEANLAPPGGKFLLFTLQRRCVPLHSLLLSGHMPIWRSKWLQRQVPGVLASKATLQTICSSLLENEKIHVTYFS